MLVAPASPRAITKRMLPRMAKASRIGMLWMEITPKAALTSHCSRKAAMAAPTVTLLSLRMTGQTSGNIDVTTRRIGRQGGCEENDGAGRFYRLAQAPQGNLLALRELTA